MVTETQRATTSATIEFSGLDIEPYQFRAWLSSNYESLPPEFWHKTPKGEYAATPTRIIVNGKDKGGRIHGLGQAGVQAIMDNMASFLFSSRPRQYNVTASSTELSISQSDYPLNGICRYFVVGHKRNCATPLDLYGAPIKPGKQAELDSLMGARLVRRLNELLEHLGMDPVDADAFGDFKAVACAPVRAGERSMRYAVDLSFRTSYRFRGPWHIGTAACKGAGRIATW